MHNGHAVRIIAAVAANGVIGRDNAMPWGPNDYPGELRHFKDATTRPGANTVIMGRATWESLPARYRPLPERTNLVLSRNPEFKSDGAERFSSLDDAVDAGETDMWIIGGGTIYEEAIGKPYLDGLVISHLDHPYEGDVRFPRIPSSFEPVERYDERHGFAIVTYERKR